VKEDRTSKSENTIKTIIEWIVADKRGVNGRYANFKPFSVLAVQKVKVNALVVAVFLV
jgi:hypothetical protein